MSTELQVILQPEIPTMGRLMALYMPGVDTAAIVMQEIEYLEYRSVFNDDIKKCIPATIVAAVKSVIKMNLSLDPDAGLIYVTTRNVKVGGEWKKALEAKPSPDGKISIARMAGRVLDVERPWVTYMADGRVDTANIKIQVPGFDEHQQPTTRWEIVTLGYTQFDRLRWFSHRDKSRNKQADEIDNKTLNWANALYTSWNGWIDPEFACAKVINAAMKRKGTNMSEKRITPFAGPQERFVSPEILKAMEDDDLDFTGYEEIPNEPTPTAASPTHTPPPPQPAAAPVVVAPVVAVNPETDAIGRINGCATKKELDELWKANKEEWTKNENIKKAANDKKAALKNPAANAPIEPAAPVVVAPTMPPPPPPPPPVAQTFNLDTTPNYDFYRKVGELPTADAIREFYNANKDAVNGDNTLKNYLVDTGRELANGRPRPVCPIELPGATAAAPEPSANNDEDFKLV